MDLVEAYRMWAARHSHLALSTQRRYGEAIYRLAREIETVRGFVDDRGWGSPPSGRYA